MPRRRGDGPQEAVVRGPVADDLAGRTRRTLPHGVT